MKILQVLPALNVGGVERGVIDIARALKRNGHESVVISSGGALVKELQKTGITHYTLPVHKKSLWSLRLVPKIARIIRRERIEIVHARSRVPGWLAWLACRQTDTPFVTTCHGYYSTHLLSRVMGWGKLVIVISRIIGRHMIDDFGVSPDRIRLVHRGVDLTQFEYAARNFQAGARPFRIINIGRLTPIKGQVEFLHAINELRKRIQNLEVWLVGSENKGKNKYTARLEETIEQLGLKSCVKLLGTRRDVTGLLKQSDLLVLSTLVPEAFGRVVIEAGAVGTPVLATRVGGVLDIIDDHQHGRYCEAGNPVSMADGMYEMLTQPEKTKQMTLALREKIEAQFSLDAMVQKNIGIYEEVCDQKRILVIKLGAVGDLILAVPSLRMLRQRYPRSTITLMVDKKWAALASSIPYIDDVMPVDRKRLSRAGYLLRTAKRLRKDTYEISVDLQNTKWTHLTAYLAGITVRYGFSRGPFGFLLNRPDHSHQAVESPVRNQFRIIQKLGVHEIDSRLELWADDACEKSVQLMLETGDGPQFERRVGFVMGSSPKWKSKRWPQASYEEMARRLTADGRTQVVLIGAQSDRDDLDRNPGIRNIPGVADLTGRTSIMELVSLVNLLDAIVCGDTAPLHIAHAFQKPAVALFGPTDPRRHVQPWSSCTVLTRHLSCQPCYSGDCSNPDKLACLKAISVDEVLTSLKNKEKAGAIL